MLQQKSGGAIPKQGKEHLHKEVWLGFKQFNESGTYWPTVLDLKPGTYYLEGAEGRGLDLYQVEDMAALLEYFETYFPTPPVLRKITVE